MFIHMYVFIVATIAGKYSFDHCLLGELPKGCEGTAWMQA